MFFASKAARELMTQTQASLEAAQKNNEILCNAVARLTSETKTVEEEVPNLDKWTAAYALNLCTVSVSQIVDYDDLRFLEREYEAILNNLNLKNMPNDDSLLDILKQLLNVITFFRIQEGDKLMLEKEYQHKMKNQIWSAVPNIGVIIATGDPVAMAVSLATQVGTGYMNYRKAKAENELEKEKQKWQLQRSAMEQFNGLRRELFNTAWRLSKRFQFEDELRLTERQITQYNDILTEEDPICRYERLGRLEDNFRAYPPFLYYWGHAAAQVYEQYKGKDSTLANKYKQFAIDKFYQYMQFAENTKTELLREDQVTASCALEYADLLMGIQGMEDKILSLLKLAQEKSGDAFDTLQLCAMTYLRMGKTAEARRLLRILVNEKYNPEINVNMLSRMYLADILRGSIEAKEEYNSLYVRRESEKSYGNYMIPIPEVKSVNETQLWELEQEYIENQKYDLIQQTNMAVEQYLLRQKREFINICMRSGRISNQIAQLFYETIEKLKKISISASETAKEKVKTYIIKEKEFRQFAEQEQYRMERKIDDYAKALFDAAKDAAKETLEGEIRNKENMEALSNVMIQLHDFAETCNLVIYSVYEAESEEKPYDEYLKIIYKENYQEEMKKQSDREKCRAIIQKYIDNVVGGDKKELEMSLYSDIVGQNYESRHYKEIQAVLSADEEWVAILNKKAKWVFGDVDLLFTTKGLVALTPGGRRSFEKRKSAYNEVKFGKKEGAIVINKYTYKNENIDLGAFGAMLEELKMSMR